MLTFVFHCFHTSRGVKCVVCGRDAESEDLLYSEVWPSIQEVVTQRLLKKEWRTNEQEVNARNEHEL